MGHDSLEGMSVKQLLSRGKVSGVASLDVRDACMHAWSFSLSYCLLGHYLSESTQRNMRHVCMYVFYVRM